MEKAKGTKVVLDKKRKAVEKKKTKVSKSIKKLSIADFSDMTQIDWYPVDPYCD